MGGLLDVCACIRELHAILTPWFPRLAEMGLGRLVMGLGGCGVRRWMGSRGRKTPGNPLSGYALQADHICEHSKTLTGESLIPEDTFSALEILKTLLSTRASADLKDSYLSAVTDLVATGKLLARAGQEIESEMIFYRLYALPSSLPQLRAGIPDALLLLAYCVFLAVGERHFWFMEGWSRGFLGEVEGRLVGEEYRTLMEWPRRHVSACLGAP